MFLFYTLALIDFSHFSITEHQTIFALLLKTKIFSIYMVMYACSSTDPDYFQCQPLFPLLLLNLKPIDAFLRPGECLPQILNVADEEIDILKSIQNLMPIEKIKKELGSFTLPSGCCKHFNKMVTSICFGANAKYQLLKKVSYILIGIKTITYGIVLNFSV